MERSIDFLRDEVRCGFYIPTAIKQAWAETLKVLDEIDRICTKHNIKYFADWGTFLGAVRHGGFVPWDDDLDICMLREDYNRFREVCDEYLPEEFVIHDYERKEDHWLFLARVVNNEKMCFEDEYLKTHNNFPWLAGVDIFIKDYIYEDDDKEIERDKDIMHIVALVDLINDGNVDAKVIQSNLEEINRRHNTNIRNDGTNRELCIKLYRLAEQLMSEVKPEETSRIGQIFPMILKSGPGFAEKKELYDDVIRIPFEDITIPVPAAYNKMLTFRYGNYCEIHKVWTGHDYPFFEGQREEMEELTGNDFSRFKFDKAMLDRTTPDKSNSLKTTAQECVNELYKLNELASNLLQDDNIEELINCINEEQQLAIDFGTLIENVKGEDNTFTKNVVDKLQKFCDALWEEYQVLERGEELSDVSLSKEALDNVNDSVNINILECKEILFLSLGPREWQSLQPYYLRERENDNTDVYVVPLPLLKKDYYGNVDMTEDEIQEAVHMNEYLEGIDYKNWYEYDISIHCPDRVYLQNPYDEANPCLTVPANYFASNIRHFTDCITYIPAYETSEFGEEDVVDQYNLNHYATAPGIVYADEVIVQSENIKTQYVNALSRFAGEDTRDYWRNKIKMKDESLNAKASDRDKKKILYCIGANELYEKKDVLLDSIKDRIELLKKSEGELDVTFTIFPEDKSQWKHVNEALSDELFNIMDNTTKLPEFDYLENGLSRVEEVAGKYDAYYGSPSPFVTAFTTQKKPVMLCDYSVKID